MLLKNNKSRKHWLWFSIPLANQRLSISKNLGKREFPRLSVYNLRDKAEFEFIK